ncbi:MAG TPA: hypothetical protein VE442_14840 [Jatrophihabitans sp.]|nr:hypothetical protein [Jatrophihabitans sp.]
MPHLRSAPVDAAHRATTTDATRAAAADARAAALTAAVDVREVREPDELLRVRDLFIGVWQEDPDDPAMSSAVLRALAACGSYVAGAWRGRELVGACVAFFGRRDDDWELHSHIAGVIPRARGSNVGFALKTHQRAWALGRDVQRISWTFDPLVARNVYFNATKLGAAVGAYLPEFYGSMNDAINGGDLTDRVMANWSLPADAVARACSGHPDEPDLAAWRAGGAVDALWADDDDRPAGQSSDADTVLISIPRDIEALRHTDPRAALAWRLALRDVLGGRLAAGWQVVGFSKRGTYVMQRGAV